MFEVFEKVKIMSSASADLGDLVDGKNTYCLNEQAAHPHANVLVDNGACLKVRRRHARGGPGCRIALAPLTGWVGARGQSADDEQLLMYFPFSEPVSLSAISIEAPSGGACSEGKGAGLLIVATGRCARRTAAESAPSLVKLYVNQPSMSFDDTDATATQVLELDEKDVAEGQLMELRFVKFQRVMGITVRGGRCDL